jgi:3-deoxy-D-manno-octulosonic-acid transferase
MNPSYTVYKWLTATSALVLVPLIWLHHRFRGHNFQRFYQRMGVYSPALRKKQNGQPRIWLHAVSVGEVGVAAAICKVLLRQYPRCQIVLSTTREQGFARARALMGEQVPCFFAPLDLVDATRRALNMIQPDALILLETEIWPNLIVNAKRMGVRTGIVNGRISVRTIASYRKVRPLMRYTFSHVDVFSMINEDDARRLVSLGANPSRVTVNGNAKFDSPDPLENTTAKAWATTLYSLQQNTSVFVAGSTRHPEEPMLLDAFLKIRAHFPDLLLILAPRHIERVDQIKQWVTAHGLTCQLRSELGDGLCPRSAPVVILDTMGELSETYCVADFVFCGGSLVPKGGQNILEPAMWGKPVLYGPSMEDFADARQLIAAAGGGVQVRDIDELAATSLTWLRHPEKAAAMGLAARQAILLHRGAAQKHADVIGRLMVA